MKFCPECRALFLNDAEICQICRRFLERIKCPVSGQAIEEELEK